MTTATNARLRLSGLLIAALASVLHAAEPASTSTRTGPAWASATGTDAYGTWADLVVGAHTQRFRYVEAGPFTMGSAITEPWRGSDEAEHHVLITRPFWLGDCEVTQAWWQAVMGPGPGAGDASMPAQPVTWEDCAKFFTRLNSAKPGLSVGFPTEAQFEYACRAGTTGPFWGDLDALMWYRANSGDAVHAVKTKAANPWGLFDMQGNVMEWCSDWWTPTTTYPALSLDPTGPTSGSLHVLKGGWCKNADVWNRAGARQRILPQQMPLPVGFRMCMPAAPVASPGHVAFSGREYAVVEGSKGQTVAAIPVVRYGGSAGAISVHFATANGTATAGTDYIAKSGTLSWGPGDCAPKSILIPVVGDTAVEPDETVLITLSDPTGKATLAAESATLTIVNDDAPTPAGRVAFTRSDFRWVRLKHHSDDMGSARAALSRVGGAVGAISVHVATADDAAARGHYTPTATDVSWADGDTAVKFVDVPMTVVATPEPDETVALTLSAPTGGASIGPPTATITIVDDHH